MGQLMGVMYDSTDPTAIPAGAAIVAGYIDGARSAWPGSGWRVWEAAGAQLVRISVLADTSALVFDAETGNAGAARVAAAVHARLLNDLPAVVYADQGWCQAVDTALAARRVAWAPAERWPRPGCYLWAADWTDFAHQDPSWAPVAPVAVQWTNGATYDTSWTAPGFPGPTLTNGGKLPKALNRPIVAVVQRPQGDGQWLIAQDGGIFSLGAAPSFGQDDPLPAVPLTPGHLIVDAACTATGEGLVLVGADGGVFTFGDAAFHGSLPGEGFSPSAQPLEA